MTSIVAANVRHIKDDPQRILDPAVVNEVARALDVRWRNRVLNPAVTIQLFLLQVLHQNVACAALPHLSGLNVTPGAYCQARQRLPLSLFTELCTRLTTALRETTAAAVQQMGRTFHGHRVCYLDGTGVSMPDAPALQKEFGKPAGSAPGLGFPMMHALFLMDAATGMILQALTAPYRTHDAASAAQTHASLAAGDILLGDRAFCSFTHLALLLQANLHGVFRAHQRLQLFVAHWDTAPRGSRKQRRGQARRQTRARQRLSHDDYVMEYCRPVQRPDWIAAARFESLPPALTVRALRFRIRKPGFRTQWIRVITTLTDPRKYSKEQLAELYLQRWKMEGWLRDLKRTLNMHVLHTTTPAGIYKELCMFVMAYNLVRLVMLRSAEQHGLDLDRVSFSDALRWLCSPWRSGDIPRLHCNPRRPGRQHPRRLKRKKDDFPYLTKSRAETMQLIRNGELAA